MLMIFVSCTLVAIHSTSEFSGDWDVYIVDQGISVFAKVAMPWCLLAMWPARAKPGIFTLAVVSQWITAVLLLKASCSITLSLAVVIKTLN